MRIWLKRIFLCLLLSGLLIPEVFAQKTRSGANSCDDGNMNTNTGQGNVVTSYDPNEMVGPIGFGDADPNAAGAKRYVLPGQWMEYKVYFENVSTATAAAQVVKVDADLSPLLDWTTFELGDIVIGNQTITDLAGNGKGVALVPLQGRSDFLQITVTLNPETGHVKWNLRIYDKTRGVDGFWPTRAEDGFLPPNDEFHNGEGHCCYRIKVKDVESVSHGDVINAAAEIVFDSNPMIPTDPAWYNTIYAEAPLASAGPADGFVDNVSPDSKILSWKDADGAESYDVVLQLMNGNTVEQSWTATGLKTSTWDLPVALINGRTYRWSVISVNGLGSAQGETWNFKAKDMSQVETQTIELKAGWNWIGFQVLPENRKIADVFGTAGFTANDQVIGALRGARFTGTRWNASFDIDYGKMYKVFVAENVTLQIEGAASEAVSVDVKSGWNWIANPTMNAVLLTDLVFSGGFTANDTMSGEKKSVKYSGTMWRNASGFKLEPGKGYKLYVEKAGTLIFEK